MNFDRVKLLGLLLVLAPVCLLPLACAKTSHIGSPADTPSAEAGTINVLFLGDNRDHQPRQRAYQLMPAMWKRGIHMTYTDDLDDLNSETLGKYDSLLIYANHEEISPDQEQALLDYVANGGGLVPLHCASFCFLNSPKYIELVGAQFQTHGEGVFTARIDNGKHQTTSGLEEFATWDETYVHTKHNPDREVLMTRVDDDGAEPWTWVRTHGKGRVFYTAYGHDERTFSQPGFQQLVEQGIRWASHRDYEKHVTPKPFKYREENIAFYPPEGERGGIREAPKEMQLPVSPEESMKHLQVQPGLRVELFASEPDIFKPIDMKWDERGRLWIVETKDYPNDRQRPGEGNDQIKILEDTNGDGKADTFTVFADKLSVPTSLAFANGGVVVFQAPDTLFLKDTDGDDKADVREVLFTGWGVFDTHAGPSNLRMGFDNWLWGTVGYSGFRGEVGGEQHEFEMGVIRFKPDGSKLEFVSPTTNNTWGLGFSETGEVFASTANADHIFSMAIPNRYYERVRGWSGRGTIRIYDHDQIHPITDRVRQVDVHGGFTAAAGSALYTARAYPEEYWNSTAFVTEPTGHLVHTCKVERDGSSFVTHDAWNLLASDDEWTAPILAEVGPDGSVWVIDWYNYIVQHNPTPRGFENGRGGAYITPLRDKTHGRIYRLVHESASDAEDFSLENASPDQLVAALANDNMFWRFTAQRLLLDRGDKDVVPALRALIENKQLDAIGNNPGALHALATLDGLGDFSASSNLATEVLTAGLNHPAAAVRRRAISLAPAAGLAMPQYIERLKDPDPNVRLDTLLALSNGTTPGNAGKAIAELVSERDAMEDRWIPTGVIAAASQHPDSFLVALANPANTISKNEATRDIVETVAEHYARGSQHPNLLALLGAWTRADTMIAEAGLDGLAAGWPEKLQPSSAKELAEALVVLSERLPAEKLATAAMLARRWGQQAAFSGKVEAILAKNRAVMHNRDLPDEQRIVAAQEALALGLSDDSLDDVLALLNPQESPELTERILEALAESEVPETAAAILQHFDSFPPASQNDAIDVLLSRADWTNTFLDKIENEEIMFPSLSVIQSGRLGNYPNRRIRRRARALLTASNSAIDPDRQNLVEDMMHLAATPGDPAVGKVVFEANCSSCHSYNGEGGDGAPVLTGVFGGNTEEILIAILDPNRSVEGNFRAWNVEMKNGDILSGLISDESKTSFTIQDALGERHTALREDVQEMSRSSLSVMPEGFESLQQDELAGLIAFLTASGDFQPLDISKAANTVSTRPMFFADEDNDDPFYEAMVFPRWGFQEFDGIPFHVIDPKIDTMPNFIMLHSPNSEQVASKPKTVSVSCDAPAKAIHLLSGVSGWGYPNSPRDSVSMIVRLHYVDSKTEDHPLINGVHFADYIRDFNVPGSTYATGLPPHGAQVRYLSITPKSNKTIKQIEFIKGEDATAPIVMGVTIERLSTED